MKEIEAEKRWVLCPLCGAKTRLQLLPETELKAFPLFCPKCRHESIINARHFIIEKQPDAKTQCWSQSRSCAAFCVLLFLRCRPRRHEDRSAGTHADHHPPGYI